MSTSYVIEAGYNSSHSKEEVSEALKEVVTRICQDPVHRLQDELASAEACFVPEVEFLEPYKLPWKDLTIQFVEDEEGFTTVRQVASGGGDSRGFKEMTRRAFCRIVLREIHARGMEVSLFVV